MSSSISRRDMLKSAAASAAVLAGATRIRTEATPTTRSVKEFIWANLLHLSYNMWCDWDNPKEKLPYIKMKPDLRFDKKVWVDLLEQMKSVGFNMVVIDLGDGVKYKTHPEIAVKNAWSRKKLRQEIDRCRLMGLEPIPKLNFSTTHDTWLKDYARQVSTPAYYTVCRDLIDEVTELFDKPRFFHLGMDEENAYLQENYEYTVVRQYALWWHDFLMLTEQVEKSGSRPWIWSDYLWNHTDTFFEKMPKSVLQSNWYYEKKFERGVKEIDAYHSLDEHGYDQVPTASNWFNPENFEMTVDYCRRNLDSQRLLGFIQTIWKPTIEECRPRHVAAIEQVARVIAKSKTALTNPAPQN